MTKLLQLIFVSYCCILCACNQQKHAVIPADAKPQKLFADSAHYKYFDAWLAASADSTGLAAYSKQYLDSLKLRVNNEEWVAANLQAYQFIYNNVPADIAQADLLLERVIATLSDSVNLQKFSAEYYLGSDLNDEGDLLKAIPHLENAYIIAKEIGYPDAADKDYLLNLLGISYTKLGDYKKASSYLLEAYHFNYDRKAFNYAAKQINNISRILYDLNLHDSAIHLLNTVNDAFEVSEKRKLNLNTELSRHFTAKNNLIDASLYLKRANSILKNLEADDVSSARLKINEASILLDGKDSSKKLATLYDLNAGAADDQRSFCKQLNMVANLHLEKNNLEEASKIFDYSLRQLCRYDSATIFSLPSVNQVYAENTIIECLDGKATIFNFLFEESRDTNYLTASLRCYELSVGIQQRLMEFFSYDDSKALLLQESRSRSEKAIMICKKLNDLAENESYSLKALQFAEANKAMILLEAIQKNVALRSELLNDDLYKKKQFLQLEILYYDRKIAGEPLDSVKKIFQSQRQHTEENLLTVNTKLAAQTRELWNNTASSNKVEQSVKIIVDEQRSLVEFFDGDSGDFAFFCSAGYPVQLVAYGKKLEEKLILFQRWFANASVLIDEPGKYKAEAFELFQLLQLSRVIESVQNLIIIPDGSFSFLPFDALITSKDSNPDLKSASYLIYSFNSSYHYSIAIASSTIAADRATVSGTVAFAPLFTGRENGFNSLPFSEREIDAIPKKNLKSFFGKEASLAAFKKQFADHSIIHIASHAVVDTANSNLNRVAFIVSNLYLEELYSLRTNADLVVMSACQTGIGALVKGEGAMSLSRGFFYAGARSTINSLWNVDDKSTASIFSSFYRTLSGKQYGRGLQDAKLSYLKTAGSVTASPYYWAGFQYFGKDAIDDTVAWQYWFLLALILIPVVYLLVRQFRKK